MDIKISQTVAILIDGNNIERSISSESNDKATMLNFESLVPRILRGRALNRLIYFREGKQISSKLAERLHNLYHGSVQPCHKSADIPLSIKASQLAAKVDTIVIASGDSDYVELVTHLKSEGVRVEIAAVKSTLAAVLLEAADYYYPITEEDWFVYTPPASQANSPRPSSQSHQNPPARQNPQRDSRPKPNAGRGTRSGPKRS